MQLVGPDLLARLSHNALPKARQMKAVSDQTIRSFERLLIAI